VSRPKKPRRPNLIANQPQDEYYVAVAFHCWRCGNFLGRWWRPTRGEYSDVPGHINLWLTGPRAGPGRSYTEDKNPAWVREVDPKVPFDRQIRGTTYRHRCPDGRRRKIDVGQRRLADLLAEIWAPDAHKNRRVDW
jgi:hypothetical protein